MKWVSATSEQTEATKAVAEVTDALPPSFGCASADLAFPNSRKVGGIASGGGAPGENALFLAEHTYRSGMIGLAMAGNVELDTVVAQGCRPIGTPMFITRCSDNILQELDGRPALGV